MSRLTRFTKSNIVDSVGDEIFTSSNPAKVDIVSELPTGTNIIGSVKVTDGTNTLSVDEANTERTTSTIVGVVQEIDTTGKVSPAGDTLANSPFCKNRPAPATAMSSTTTLVPVDTTVGGTVIVSANSNRRKLVLRNNGTVPVLIKINGTPTTLDYNEIIAGGSAPRSGDSGVWGTETILLEIKGITESSASIISVTEEEIT